MSVCLSVTLRSGSSVSSASSTCDHPKSWSFLFFCCVFESCFVRFRFVLFRWLQMIKKIEDWFAIIFIWNIYIICTRLHLQGKVARRAMCSKNKKMRTLPQMILRSCNPAIMRSCNPAILNKISVSAIICNHPTNLNNKVKKTHLQTG